MVSVSYFVDFWLILRYVSDEICVCFEQWWRYVKSRIFLHSLSGVAMSKEKVLKVKDLIQIFQTGLVSKQSLEDRVVVAVESTLATLGGRPTVDVFRAFSGFDWERGKFILVTDKNLMTLDSEGEREVDAVRREYDRQATELWQLKKEIKRIKSIVFNDKLDSQKKLDEISLKLKEFKVGGVVLSAVNNDDD